MYVSYVVWALLRFPQDFPDTQAWRSHCEVMERLTTESLSARPKGKRPNALRLRSPCPFYPDWSLVWPEDEQSDAETKEEGDDDASVSSEAAGKAPAVFPCVVRGLRYLKPLVPSVPRAGEARLVPTPPAGPMLAECRVRFLGTGSLQPNAMVRSRRQPFRLADQFASGTWPRCSMFRFHWLKCVVWVLPDLYAHA